MNGRKVSFALLLDWLKDSTTYSMWVLSKMRAPLTHQFYSGTV